MNKILKNIYVLRLVVALVLFTSMPAHTQAALIDVNGIGFWLRDKITLAPRNFLDLRSSSEVGSVVGPFAWAAPVKLDNTSGLATVGNMALMPASHPLTGVSRVYETYVTAYSSSADETDSTPFVTASGEWVRDGIVAANFLPFGTKVKIPEIFGEKIFTVKDRMNRRHTDKVDVWFESKDLAREFGRKKAQVMVLEENI